LQEYDVYLNVMYLHVAVVFVLVAGMAVLALTVDKVPKSRKLQKWVKLLHVSVLHQHFFTSTNGQSCRASVAGIGSKAHLHSLAAFTVQPVGPRHNS